MQGNIWAGYPISGRESGFRDGQNSSTSPNSDGIPFEILVNALFEDREGKHMGRASRRRNWAAAYS